VLDDGVARDFTQGAMTKTGGDFDLAIEGKGFFKVQTAGGERYTRDGRFTTNPEGQLVTQAGNPVLDDGGGPLTIDPRLGPVNIGQDGTVSQGAVPSARSPWSARRPGRFRKDGDNLYRNTTNTTLQPPRTRASTRACWKPPTSNPSPRSPS
jgi:flagellar basal-body rod protein FlgF